MTIDDIVNAVNRLAQLQQQGFTGVGSLLQQQLFVLSQLQQQSSRGGGGGGGAGGGGGTGGTGGFGGGLFQSLMAKFFPQPGRVGGSIGGSVQNMGNIFASWQRARAAAQLPGPAAPGATTGPGTQAPGLSQLFFGGGFPGGGAGIAGGGGAAGALNIAGVIIVAAANMWKELAKIPGRIADFGQALLDAQRKIAQFSGEIAAILVRGQVREIQRAQIVGHSTAENLDEMNEALQDVKDRLAVFEIIATNLKASLETWLLRTIAQPMLDGVASLAINNRIGRSLLAGLAATGAFGRGGGADLNLTAWLNQVANDASEGRAGRDRDAFSPNWSGI